MKRFFLFLALISCISCLYAQRKLSYNDRFYFKTWAEIIETKDGIKRTYLECIRISFCPLIGFKIHVDESSECIFHLEDDNTIKYSEDIVEEEGIGKSIIYYLKCHNKVIGTTNNPKFSHCFFKDMSTGYNLMINFLNGGVEFDKNTYKFKSKDNKIIRYVSGEEIDSALLHIVKMYANNSNGTTKSKSNNQHYFADSYMTGIYSQENTVFRYDRDNNVQGYSREKVMILGSKEGLGVICRGLGINLFFYASSGNCYITEYEGEITDYTWTHGRQMSSQKEDCDYHFALTTTDKDDHALNIIKTINGKVVETYRILVEQDKPITFVPDNSEVREKIIGLELESKLLGQFGYHGYKSGSVHRGEPKF